MIRVRQAAAQLTDAHALDRGLQELIEALRAYFATVKKGLGKEGVFMLDAYGGWESIEPMLEPFGEVVSSLDLSAPTLPVISNTTGEQLTDRAKGADVTAIGADELG